MFIGKVYRSNSEIKFIINKISKQERYSKYSDDANSCYHLQAPRVVLPF